MTTRWENEWYIRQEDKRRRLESQAYNKKLEENRTLDQKRDFNYMLGDIAEHIRRCIDQNWHISVQLIKQYNELRNK